MKNKYEYLITEESNINIDDLKNSNNYRIATDLSISDIKYLLTCSYFKNFSPRYYTILDIDTVMEEKNIAEFQSINPVLFNLYMKSKMLKRYQAFWAQNITKEQLIYCPYAVMKRLNTEALEVLKARFQDEAAMKYSFLSITDKTTKQRLFVPKSIAPISVTVERAYKNSFKSENQTTLSRESLKGIFEDNLIDFEKAGLYLDLNLVTFNNFRHYKAGKCFTYLIEVAPAGRACSKFVTTESFKTMLDNIYTPATASGAVVPSCIYPEDGLYSSEELIEEYTIKISQIQNAIRNGLIGYYRLSSKIVRISKADFEDYINRKINYKENKIYKRGIKGDISEYISELEILENTQEIHNVEAAKNNTVISKFFRKHCKYYFNEDNTIYYKKTDISEFLKSKYGYYGPNDEFELKETKCEIFEYTDFIDKKTALKIIEEKCNCDTASARKKFAQMAECKYLPCIKAILNKEYKYVRNYLIREDDLLTAIEKLKDEKK